MSMLISSQIAPGMTISVDGNIFRVESCVTVTVAKGIPFVKTRLKNMITEDLIDKNFKVDQEVEEVKLTEHTIEYLYLEGKHHEFLDVDQLDQISVEQSIIEDKVQYLKEGIQLTALFYGKQIFSVELPQFLELMVVKTEDPDQRKSLSNTTKSATLETGASVEVPMFIESGDIIKVDTLNGTFVQRV